MEKENNKPLILIVDDIPRNLQVLGTILKEQDFDVSVATNGESALEMLTHIKPDLILLDVMMPGISGFDVCKQIKGNPQTEEIPIIFLTAKTDSEDIIQGLKLGAVDYVTKPFNGMELLTRVKAHVELKLSRESLKELNATKDKFFSIIAHDLKSPIAAVQQATEFIIDSYDEFDKEIFLDLINDLHHSSKSLMSLLENLLNWAQSQTGHLHFNPVTLTLSKLAQSNFSILQNSANTKNISLEINIPEKLTIYADKNMICTVMRNLVSNAIKYTQNGKVTVKAEADENNVIIAVTDTGLGINKKNIDQLFQLDTQLSTTGTNNEKGTGLGLILCKAFIEKHEGTIKAESEVGKGTTFTITLPKNN